MAFSRAERKRAKARIGICGPAGSGKTMSALRLAFGIVGTTGKIAVIDTEHGSASLYANDVPGPYDTMELEAPFTVQKYIAGIREAECLGYDLIIIDSLSHAWAGSGGLLEMVDKKGGSGGNKFAGWRDVTPLHNELVEAMLQSRIHVIATMRSKTEYVLEDDSRGKKVPKKVGMAPVQREGMDFEFTLVFDVDQDNHRATASKDRTSVFKNITQLFNNHLTEEEGHLIKSWLETGVEAPAPASRAAQDQGQAPAHPQQPTGGSVSSMFINPDQIGAINKLILETNADLAKFLEAFKVASLDKLPTSQYDTAIKALEKKKQQGTAAPGSAAVGSPPPGAQDGTITETLKARNIPHEVVDGNILAKPKFSDAGARDFLKQQGFAWDGKEKAWKHAA